MLGGPSFKQLLQVDYRAPLLPGPRGGRGGGQGRQLVGQLCGVSLGMGRGLLGVVVRVVTGRAPYVKGGVAVRLGGGVSCCPETVQQGGLVAGQGGRLAGAGVAHYSGCRSLLLHMVHLTSHLSGCGLELDLPTSHTHQVPHRAGLVY